MKAMQTQYLRGCHDASPRRTRAKIAGRLSGYLMPAISQKHPSTSHLIQFNLIYFNRSDLILGGIAFK
jgi:hypothetical protein